MEFINFISPLIDFLGPFIYLVVFLVSILESLVIVGIFIPGSIFISFVGFIASTDSLSLALLITATTGGAAIGDSISYYLGRYGGPSILKKFGGKYFKESYLDAGKMFLYKHGNKSVFLGRFIAPMRPFIPFVAGLFGMGFWRFSFWNLCSAFFWGLVYLAIGYIFGSTWEIIVERIGAVGLIIFGIIVIGIGVYTIKNKLKKIKSK